MIVLESFKIDSAYPCLYFATYGIHCHKASLQHLPVVFNGVIRSHNSVFVPVVIPCKNFHRNRVIKRFPDISFANAIITHTLPAVAVFHVAFQNIFMIFPYQTFFYARLAY